MYRAIRATLLTLIAAALLAYVVTKTNAERDIQYKTRMRFFDDQLELLDKLQASNQQALEMVQALQNQLSEKLPDDK